MHMFCPAVSFAVKRIVIGGRIFYRSRGKDTHTSIFVTPKTSVLSISIAVLLKHPIASKGRISSHKSFRKSKRVICYFKLYKEHDQREYNLVGPVEPAGTYASQGTTSMPYCGSFPRLPGPTGLTRCWCSRRVLRLINDELALLWVLPTVVGPCRD
ncbi:arginine biosynthesis bifunctional protein ArgJ [Striga asiatica]|uniref:Arginine biosynthesis bifunctional protein ArgJ n=1 Tax=Striga asiatica TaxID=4170 RepID=A0A5A7PMY1_STRAF|nr:arginine biosynthesis bifunctional protein ArgJ [Striga asiatica]